MFAIIRFPARVSLRESIIVPSRAWLMLRKRKEQADKASCIVHAIASSQQVKAKRWDIFFIEFYSGCEFIDEESSLIIRWMQFSFSTIELNWPYLRLLFFSNRYSFVHSHLSRFPHRNCKYINEYDFLSFFSSSAGYTEDLVQARPHDQQRLLIRCQELYLKIRRSSIHLRSRWSFMRARIIGMKILYLFTMLSDIMYPKKKSRRAWKKSLTRLVFPPSIFSSSTLIFTYYASPSRYTRVY